MTDINNSMDKFIGRLDFKKKRINKWKTNKQKNIQTKSQRSMSNKYRKHKKSMRHRMQSENIKICIIGALKGEEGHDGQK